MEIWHALKCIELYPDSHWSYVRPIQFTAVEHSCLETSRTDWFVDMIPRTIHHRRYFLRIWRHQPWGPIHRVFDFGSCTQLDIWIDTPFSPSVIPSFTACFPLHRHNSMKQTFSSLYSTQTVAMPAISQYHYRHLRSVAATHCAPDSV